MNKETELKAAAEQTVTSLLEALKESNAENYRLLMSDSDQEMISADLLAENMAAMREQSGRLKSFRIEGIILQTAARYAAAHVNLEFENSLPQTELYHLTLEDSGWRVNFDFAELLGGS